MLKRLKTVEKKTTTTPKWSTLFCCRAPCMHSVYNAYINFLQYCMTPALLHIILISCWFSYKSDVNDTIGGTMSNVYIAYKVHVKVNLSGF